MSCERIQVELVGYHFGVIDDGLRLQIEEHLAGCPGCLRSFFDLKRDVETAESAPRPSPAVLDRLRASAARELGVGEPERWSWWERPLAFGFGGLMVLVAMIAVTVVAPGTPPRGLVGPPITSSPGAR